jgi:hypothetical protein
MIHLLKSNQFLSLEAHESRFLEAPLVRDFFHLKNGARKYFENTSNQYANIRIQGKQE